MRNFRHHIFALSVLVLVWLTGTHAALLDTLSDLRSAWFPRTATGGVVLVGIDAYSITKMGGWPWPRQLHADLIAKLQKAGVQDIAFDVDFSSPSNPASDAAFADALRQAGSVILPVFRQPVLRGFQLNQPLAEFRKSSWSALVNVAPEANGIVRQYPIGDSVNGQFLPSLAALLMGGLPGKTGSFYVDFSIEPKTIPIVSYADVINEDPSTLQTVKDKKVIVGGTALELGDRFTVPRGRIIAGPVLQALAAESLGQNRALHRTDRLFSWIIVGLIGLSMLVLWRRLSGLQRGLLLATAAVVVEVAAAILQSRMPIIWDTSPVVVVAGAYLLALGLDEIDFWAMLSRISEDRFQRVTMSLGDALICTDRTGVITVCNPAAAAMFSYPPGELVGRSVESFIRNSQNEKLVVADALAANAAIEMEGIRNGGMAFPIEARLSSWDADGVRHYGLVIRDITERKREAEKIRRLAERDFLTGLANRHTLNEHIAAKLKTCDVMTAEVALILLDLDKFKEVNDTLGHAYGDQVLIAVSERLLSLVSADALVARLGGDEFAILISGKEAAARARTVCQAIATTFKDSAIVALDRPVNLDACLGVAVYPVDATAADELFANADLALYRAKVLGSGSLCFFEHGFRTDFEARLALERELQRAVDNNEFELFYQPQVDLQRGGLVGAEALIRWRHPERGLVSPAEFIPVLNRSALSNRVGEWVLRTACQQGAKWMAAGHRIRIAVNLASSQLQSADLPATVRAALASSGFSPNQLELEVTEDSVIADEEQALDAIHTIQKAGVRLAFDDFGTGYASLSYLKKFRLDVLKIDKSFVMGLNSSPDDMAIVGATLAISKQLGLSVIAEGVEDAAIADTLRRLGCAEAQGYYYGKPMPAPEFEQKMLQAAVSPAA